MFSKLAAQNILKTTFKGQCLLSVNKKYLAYANEKLIKIKALHSNIAEFELPVQNSSFNFTLSTQEPFLQVLNKEKVLTIYQLDITNQSLSCKKVRELNGIFSFKEVHGGLAVIQQNFVLKYISFASIQVSQPVKQCQAASTFLAVDSQNNGIYVQSDQNLQIYEIRKNGKYENVSQMKTKGETVALYKDRYLFQRINSCLEICDISDKKPIGNFILEGKIKYSTLRQNLLLIVIQKQEFDIYNFFILNNDIKQNEEIILNRSIYQKAKSDWFGLINTSKKQSVSFTESKKKEARDITEHYPKQINPETCSIIYTSAKDKGKIQIIKVDHNKIFQSKFSEAKIQKNPTFVSENQQNFANSEPQIEKARIQATIDKKMVNQNKSNKSNEQIQQQFIQKIVISKMKIFARKFSQLEKKVQNLQKTIKSIYQKMQQSLQNLNQTQVQKSVQKLFVQLTPQFQKYFTQVFRQVSGVLQQGASYYNFKLQKQAQIHKQALTDIIKLSFSATNDIVELSKEEMKYSKKAQQSLKQLATLKKNWVEATDMFEDRMRKIKTQSPDKGEIKKENKAFVKANLGKFENYT